MSFRSFFRSFFTEHLWLKAFSLVLATLIWLTVRSNLESETRQESKRLVGQSVALLTDPSERRAFVIDPATVNVMVKGPKTLIDDLTDVQAFVELASHSGNMNNYNVEVHAPAGVTVLRISPSSVFVRPVEGQ